MGFLNLYWQHAETLKMSRHSDSDSTNVPLIITTNEAGEKPITSTTSSLDLSYKAKSCRSFIRQSKLNTEHRNKSVPHNLQVRWTNYNDYCVTL